MTNEINESNQRKGRGYAADYIRNKIRKGEYLPGEKLPSMEELSKELGLHHNTLDAGLQLLKNEKLVETNTSNGTMVCKKLPMGFKNVALILPDTESKHWPRVAKGIQSQLKCSGWELDVCPHNGSSWTFHKLIRRLRSGRYTGALIAAPHDLIDGYIPLINLVQSGFPVTFIGHYPSGVDCWSIDDADFAGGYHGTKHLIDFRFKRIGLIGCKLYNGEDFIDGCRHALSEYNSDPMAVGYAAESKHALKLLISWLESDEIRLDSVFFQQVEHAKSAFDYLQSKRIPLGRSMGFMTMDDTVFHKLSIPSPTAIRRFPEQLAKRISKLFLEQIRLPFEQRNFARTLEAQVGIDVGRTTSDRRARKVFYAENPYGGVRNYELLHGRFPY